jgi:hypothetical protein
MRAALRKPSQSTAASDTTRKRIDRLCRTDSYRELDKFGSKV